MTAFLNTLTNITRLSPGELTALSDIAKEMSLAKGEWWVKEGLRADKLGFIEEGYLRKYYLKDGKELTDYFYFDHSFIGDIPAIVTKQPSIVNVIAMEPTRLLTFSYAAIEELCARFHGIERLMRIMIERTFITFYHKSTSFILSSPQERYRDLLTHQPQVLERATQYHIASFLGITPQHLSRLRAQK